MGNEGKGEFANRLMTMVSQSQLSSLAFARKLKAQMKHVSCVKVWEGHVSQIAIWSAAGRAFCACEYCTSFVTRQ